MSTITKERIANLIEFNSEGSDCQANAEQWEVHELARIALTSLEAEAVCVIDQSNLDYLKSGADADVWPASRKEMGDVLLYRTAPPAPVVPDEREAFNVWNNDTDCPLAGLNVKQAAWLAWLKRSGTIKSFEPATDEFEVWARSEGLIHDSYGLRTVNTSADVARKAWNACRAAMLQTVNSPVIPDKWIQVSERMPPNKPGSYEYIVFDSLNNRAHHDYWNVPDGSCDDFSPFWNHYGKYVTHWMPLPAAPQQEVNNV